jgi:hypothetical protein
MTVRERAEKFLEGRSVVDVRQCLPKEGGVTVFGGGHEGDLGGSDSCPEDFRTGGMFSVVMTYEIFYCRLLISRWMRCRNQVRSFRYYWGDGRSWVKEI